MDLILHATIVIAYLTIGVELTWLHVPSIASFRSIWTASDDTVASYTDRYQNFFRHGRLVKLVLFIPPLLVIYAVFLFPVWVVVAGLPPWISLIYDPGSWVQLLSIVLVIAGRWFGFAAVITMTRSARGADTKGLLTSGPFRYSRNPGLTGMYIMFIGIWLSMPAVPFLLGILIYVLYMHLKVRMEEDFLSGKFGSEFDAYKQKTGRYLL